MRNKVILISGYTATGKDSVAKELVKKYNYRLAVSHTTRSMRSGEMMGREYFFTDEDKFYNMVENGEFIEMRKYFTNVMVGGESKKSTWLYGLSKVQLRDFSKPTIVIADKQGCEQVAEYIGKNNCVWVHLECDEEVLRRRLLARGDYKGEATRRLRDDKRSFKGIENCVHAVINTDMELERVVESVKDVYDYYNGL